ncbi:MAG: molybdopterin molybdotransferase MoeA [Isosphaeraceae bacterium]|nr:molybdopterin molybdotransferase MoeA [Isosphaeraceae bacterium]
MSEHERIPPGYRDPRGRGFRSRSSVESVQMWIDSHVRTRGSEVVSLIDAAGRVLASELRADRPVPSFDRAAMDGFAVRGEETFGADLYSPMVLRVVGASRPGIGFLGHLGPGEAVFVATGAPLPSGADAVVPVEASRPVDAAGLGDPRVEITEPISPGRHVGRCGEDLREGTVALAAGRRLRPQDLGLASALGLSRIPVVRRPTVTLLVTGDELLPAGSISDGFRIADMNSPMIAALVARDGGILTTDGPLPDDRDSLRNRLVEAASTSDFVLISGGSSTGPEDHAPGLVAELGSLDHHGVALRPASPFGVGRVGDVPVFLLPGNPVSCLCAYDLFAGRAIRAAGGLRTEWPYRSVEGILAAKLVSSLGRVDYTRVRYDGREVEPLATSGASILSSTTRADGFVLVPADSEGLAAGSLVKVWLYDRD